MVGPEQILSWSENNNEHGQEFRDECVWCQKSRHGLVDSLSAPIRATVAEHPRHICDYDLFYITPEEDEEGFKFLYIQIGTVQTNCSK